MSVATLLEQTQAPTSVVCVICRSAVPAYQVTNGTLYADGTPAFACHAHMRDRQRWILSWIRFAVHQENLRADLPNVAGIIR